GMKEANESEESPKTPNHSRGHGRRNLRGRQMGADASDGRLESSLGRNRQVAHADQTWPGPPAARKQPARSLGRHADEFAAEQYLSGRTASAACDRSLVAGQPGECHVPGAAMET